MGMAIFSPTVSRPPMLALLLAPLQDLFALLGSNSVAPAKDRYSGTGSKTASTTSPRRATRALDKAPWRATNPEALKTQGHDVEKNISIPAVPSRLRVVRAFDPGMAPSCAGRMVISGRMADVCAELDRMTQKEAYYRQQ